MCVCVRFLFRFFEYVLCLFLGALTYGRTTGQRSNPRKTRMHNLSTLCGNADRRPMPFRITSLNTNHTLPLHDLFINSYFRCFVSLQVCFVAIVEPDDRAVVSCRIACALFCVLVCFIIENQNAHVMMVSGSSGYYSAIESGGAISRGCHTFV